MRDESIFGLLFNIELVSVNQPKSGILPSTAETMQYDWYLFPNEIVAVSVPAKLPVLKILVVLAGMVQYSLP